MPSKEKGEQPLKGICAFVSVANDDGTDASTKYVEILQTLGAKICNSRLAGITHMIFRNGDQDKLAIAHQKDALVVSPQWVDKCRDFLLRVSEDEFPVGENIVPAAFKIGDKKRSSNGRKSMETTSNQARLLPSPGDPMFSSSQAEGSAEPKRKRERKLVKAQPVVQRVTRSSPVSSPTPSETANSELRRSSRGKGSEGDSRSDAKKTRYTSTGTAKSDTPFRDESQSEREEIVKEQSIVAGRASKSTPLFSPAPPEPHNSDLRRSSRGKGLESILKSVTANNRRSSTETVKSDATRMEDSPSGKKVNKELLDFMNQNSSVSSASKVTPSIGGKCVSKPLSEAMLEKNWGSGNKKTKQAPRESTITLVEGETSDVLEQYLKSPEQEAAGGISAHRTPMIMSPSAAHEEEKQGKIKKISIGKPQKIVKDLGRGKWSCMACTVLNNGRAPKCVECGTLKGEERPREIAGLVGEAAKPEKTAEEVGKGRKKGDAQRKATPEEEKEKVGRVSSSAPQTLEDFDAEMAETQQSQGKKERKEPKSRRKAPAKGGKAPAKAAKATRKNGGARKKTVEEEEDTDDMVISDDSGPEGVQLKPTADGKKVENKPGKRGAKNTNSDKENKAPKRARRGQGASKDDCEIPDEEDIGKSKKKSKIEQDKKAFEPDEEADKNNDVPTISIVLSSFSPEKKEELLKLTRTLIKRVEAKSTEIAEEGKAVIVRLVNSEDATADCTHLVVPSAQCKRTLKLLFAVARERYILTEDWLWACAERGEWLSEKEFEVERFKTGHPPTPKQIGSILSDETIYVGPTNDPEAKVIKKLVQAAGGRICQTLRSATLCVGQREPCRMWIQQEMEKSTSCQTLNTLIQKSAVVDTTWLYDAIENRQKPVDKSKYELGRKLMH